MTRLYKTNVIFNKYSYHLYSRLLKLLAVFFFSQRSKHILIVEPRTLRTQTLTVTANVYQALG